MEFITYLQQRLGEQVPEIIGEYEGEIEANDLSEIEVAVKEMTHQLGNTIIQQVLEAQEPRYPTDERTCPHVGKVRDINGGAQGWSSPCRDGCTIDGAITSVGIVGRVIIRWMSA